MFERMGVDDFEQVVFGYDRATGLRSIIAIHDTTLGPALGGVRMVPYESEADALEDCLRLARGMTYKAAAAGVNLGGGKSVIIADPDTDKSEALLRAHGRLIQSLGGRYIPGIDIGTDMADLEVIGVEATRVSCVGMDPSPMTALGVISGIAVCLDHVFGDSSFDGRRIAVQGVGHVGECVARMASERGARVVVADVRADRASKLAADVGGEAVGPGEIVSVECDVFAPCAMGGVVNDDSLDQLGCRVIAGSANNVLEHPALGASLSDRGIIYAPDFVVNAGGLILLEEEMLGHDRERLTRRVRGVGKLVQGVIRYASEHGIPTSEAADRLAEDRLSSLAAPGLRYLAPQPDRV